MKNKRRLWLGAAIAATVIPLTASASFGACPGDINGDIILRDSTGAAISNATTPYSPKETCMATGCHTGEEYRSSTTKHVTKTQGVLDPNGEILWQSYNVDSAAHGAVVGRHAQQGRNEDYSIAMKKVFKDAYFTSSPGMYGKY